MAFITFSKKAKIESDKMIKGEIGTILSDQFGPCPWALEGRKSGLYRDDEQLEWRMSRGSGVCKLYAPKTRKTYFLLQPTSGSQSFIEVIDKNTFIAIGADKGNVHVVEFTLDSLDPIHNSEEKAKEMSTKEIFHYALGKPFRTSSFPRNLSAGKHMLTQKQKQGVASSGKGEVVHLFNTTNKELKQLLGEHETCLAIIDTRKGGVTIVPQVWFSNGGWDYGYVWLARAARIEKSGDICIEGVRMGVIELDKKGEKVKRWISKFNFHGIGTMDLSNDMIWDGDEPLEVKDLKMTKLK